MYGTYAKLFLPILGSFIAAVQLYYYRTPGDENAGKYLGTNQALVVIILSARQNFINREVLRKSWISNIPEEQEFSYKFIIGNECSIPPKDRSDKYSCKELSHLEIDDVINTKKKENILGNLSCSSRDSNEKKLNLSTSSKGCYSGFGFHAVYSLVLHSVGILREIVANTQENIQIVFRDSEEVFEHFNISKYSSCSYMQNEFCFIKLEQELMLPENFEGEIYLSMDGVDRPNFHKCSWSSEGYFRFTFGKRGSLHEKYEEGSCSYVVANFSLADKRSFKRHLKEKPTRRTEWADKLRKINQSIQEETEKYNDIVYVPEVVDVYRNLPMKVLATLKWAHKTYPTSYVLKVDDDTWVNVSFLVDNLPIQSANEETLAMWSHFYRNRFVPLSGKWADYEFQSQTYPPFPCGSGYLLTGPLVSLLSSNANILRPFQGEDVSIGIWTEFLQFKEEVVQKIDVKCWLPSTACNPSVLIPDVPPERMLKLGNLGSLHDV